MGKPYLLKEDYIPQKLTLYSWIGNFRGNQVELAASLLNIPLNKVYISQSELKTPVNLARNPLGKVPTLQTPDGFLTETTAILRYLARATPLYGLEGFSMAKVDQWLDWYNTELMLYGCPLLKEHWGYISKLGEERKGLRTQVLARLKQLNDALGS